MGGAACGQAGNSKSKSKSRGGGSSAYMSWEASWEGFLVGTNVMRVCLEENTAVARVTL